MGYSQYDPAMQSRAPWNLGKTVDIKRPLTQKQIANVPTAEFERQVESDERLSC